MKLHAVIVLAITVQLVVSIDENAQLKCDFSDNTVASSAYQRANSTECRSKIESVACHFKVRDSLGPSHVFERISPKCPVINARKGELLACLTRNEMKEQTDIFVQLKIRFDFNINLSIYNHQVCVDVCLSNSGFQYAAYNAEEVDNGMRRYICSCFEKIPTASRSLYKKSCDNYGQNNPEVYYIYLTGLLMKERMITYNPRAESHAELIKIYNRDLNSPSKKRRPPRIVFFLIINERSYERQIFRFLKTIYDKHHYYYIHIDRKSNFLKRKVEALLAVRNVSNILISPRYMSIVWGGSSLLAMHLAVLADLVELKKAKVWDWDYWINLSESDYPIKSIQDWALFLTLYPNHSVLPFLDKGYFDKKSTVMDHGMFWLFLECDDHMWRVVNRTAPVGVQYEGATDWICLHYNFVEYFITTNDQYVKVLTDFFMYVQVPTEQLQQNPSFFARKFDPTFNMKIINTIHESIYGPYPRDFKSLNAYWSNIYDIEDEEDLLRVEHKFRIFMADLFKNTYIQLAKKMSNSDIPNDIARVNLATIASRITSFLTSSDRFAFPQLNNIHWFFNNDEFKGIVLNFNLSDTKPGLTFEAFFKIKTSKKDETSFYTYFEKIEVSTEFDLKELRCHNYANVMDQHSVPILSVNYIQFTAVDLNFVALWFDPNNKLFKRHTFEFKSGHHKIEQFAMLKLYSDTTSKVLTAGVWRVDIYLADDMDDVLHTQEFLILPSETLFKLDFEKYKKVLADNDKKFMMKNLENFWAYASICFHNLDIESEDLSDCDRDASAYWSTYYPDPKSDLIGQIDAGGTLFH